MKKLKTLGVIFLMAVCTCLFALTAFADNNNPQKLETPSWVRWDNNDGLYAKFEEIDGAEGLYSVRIHRNNQNFMTISNSGSNPISEGRLALWFRIYESGSYTFQVKALGDGITTLDSEWSEWSKPFEYQKPAKAFGNVQNLHWSDLESGTVTWDPPVNMVDIPEDSRGSLRYYVRLYKDGEQVFGMYNLTDLEADLSQWMGEEAEYKFSVQAQSRHIDRVSHGKEIMSDEYLDTGEIAGQIGGELDDIWFRISGEDENGQLASPSDALEAVEELDLKETAIAVQTDEAVLSILSDIETFYLEQSGKSVEKNVSEDAGFSADDIEVIGAGLNIASPSDAIEVNVKKGSPDDGADIDDVLYANVNVFEISLKNAVGKLRAPITIIMPVPEGINPDRLRILHYHGNECKVIYPIVTADGKAKFTVTEFSRFAFVERNENPDYGKDDPEEVDPGDSGNSGGSGGSSGGGGGGRSTTSGIVTTDSKKGQVHSITGIITGSGDGYSKWISETLQEGAEIRWKLQYADGTFAAGSYVTDEQGNPVKDAAGNLVEQPLWEMVNGAWYAFGADGYVKTGRIFDPAQNGWFYVDVNTGMKTGWQQIDGKWYYFNQASDGTKGIMYTSRTTPDGYNVKEDGSWDGQE